MAVEAITRISSIPRFSLWMRAPSPPRGRGERETTVRLAEGLRRRRLENVDAEVRAHEAAHLAALGAVAGGGASFSFVIGPDGERYAVGGSVPAAVSPVPGDPEATIRRAKALIQAAYAVAMPSSADMRVAAEAYRMEVQAQKELEDNSEGAPVERGEEREISGGRPRREWFA
jgi:hypothetical protein